MDATTEATPSPQPTSSYTSYAPRISKENLFMVLALWMEQFPLKDNQDADSYRKVGAVLVLPNDMLHAVDCSRDGVHGIARLLTKNYDVTKDCKIYVSRKPWYGMVWYIFKVANVGSGCPISRARGSCYKRATITQHNG